MTRTSCKTVKVEAENPHNAARIAIQENPEFNAHTVAFVPDGNESDSPEWEILSECESCRKVIFIGDNYCLTADDCYLCPACMP